MLETHRKGDGLLASAYRALVATLVGTALTILEVQPSKAAEPTDLKTLVVLPFEIQDTSGEVGPADRHDTALGRQPRLFAMRLHPGSFIVWSLRTELTGPWRR